MAPKPSSGAGRKKNNQPATPHAKPPPPPPPPPATPSERELQSLAAAQARTATWARRAAGQAALHLRCATLLALVALAAAVSQLALAPVYGAVPAARWHNHLLMAGCFAGWSSNLLLGRLLRRRGGPAPLLPLLAAYVPVARAVLGRCSGLLTARWGPLVTEGVVLFPVVVLSTACVATELDAVDLGALPAWAADAAPGLGSYGFFKLAEKVLGGLVRRHVGHGFFNTRLGMEMVLAASYALVAPSRLLVWILPALLHTAVFNTHVPTSTALARMNSGLEPTGFVVLDRQESVTGYLSVIDNLKDGYRVMRCDHSILGGEWVKFLGQGQFRGNQVAEPVYGVFAMLEAVRLVELPKPIADSEANALVIGLGVGTTPAALIAHGIDTTVVEIDPVVYQFASQYFQLPRNHTAVIEDAVSYTSRQAANETAPRFDYIIHDVFTGGAEPIALFTLEFLQDLDALLKPDGVIAINYAGDFALPPPGIIVRTVRAVFPACRLFREHPRDDDDFAASGRDFTNMVIFCTKQAGGGISFRDPEERDLLNSPSRRAFLLPRHEVGEGDFAADDGAGILRRNDTERLRVWHGMSALGHWAVMRTVLPAAVWEAW
ncbi:S-adenosyl-L-methionine-dependent methyltransferase [Trichocladium antarcticum]|uniref:S-adenosyl-L-methionine-dependent methyltransferase n=1 Tax=Trichocladium antarcticum TaxID=1450529 RepID=A0AAN6UE55_9PEZI|nr:S-adenosyl-L-methionine-dependent methyltransferase [Trichocladium antarcticum]